MKLQLGFTLGVSILAAAQLMAPATSAAADLGITSDTIVRLYERDDSGGRQRSLLPVYEFLRLDYTAPKTPGLSLHAYGWGRANLRDDFGNADDTADGELLYAYLDYLDPKNRDYQVRAGRQYIFEGVMREAIDGLYAKTDLLPTVTASAYAGLPVNLEDEKGRGGDWIYGARVAQGIPGRYDVALAYKQTLNHGSTDEQLVGADATLLLPANMTLVGHTTYNLVTGGWGEHSYELRLPFKAFELRPFYQRYRYEDFLNRRAGGSAPFRYMSQLGEKVDIAGTEAFWYPAENIEFGARYKHYEYDSRYGSANMYTVLAAIRRKIFSEVGGEFGRVEGDMAQNRYYLGRAYAYWDIAPLFVTADVVYVNYDEGDVWSMYGEDSAFFASIGVGRKFLDKSLNVKLSLDYSRDPYFDKDYRGTLAASYAFGK